MNDAFEERWCDVANKLWVKCDNLEECEDFCDWLNSIGSTDFRGHNYHAGVIWMGFYDDVGGSGILFSNEGYVRSSYGKLVPPDGELKNFEYLRYFTKFPKTGEMYAREPVKCPFCDSTDLDAGLIEIEGAEAFQKVNCLNCKEVWKDLHKLVGYEEVVVEGE